MGGLQVFGCLLHNGNDLVRRTSLCPFRLHHAHAIFPHFYRAGLIAAAEAELQRPLGRAEDGGAGRHQRRVQPARGELEPPVGQADVDVALVGRIMPDEPRQRVGRDWHLA